MPRSNIHKALGTCPIEGQRGRPSFVGGAVPALAERLQATRSCPSARSRTAWMLHAHRGLGSLAWPGDITSENNQETAPAVWELPANPQSPAATTGAFIAACHSVSSVSAQRFDLFFLSIALSLIFLSCHASRHFAREQVEIMHFTRKSQH